MLNLRQNLFAVFDRQQRSYKKQSASLTNLMYCNYIWVGGQDTSVFT